MSSNPLCCFVIGAEEPGHLEGAVPGEAAGLSPPPAASAANTAGQMPRFPLLHLVTRPALGKRRGLRGPETSECPPSAVAGGAGTHPPEQQPQASHWAGTSRGCR